MGYYNLIYQNGESNFLKNCKSSGVDGLIIVDLPYPENKNFANKCKKKGINFVQLLSPTTSRERMKKIIKDSHDMIYYISMLSTTGGKLKVSPKKILENYNKIKRINPKKNLVIGFGITDKTISSLKSANGLVVGSLLCKTITNSLKMRQNPVTKLDKVVYNLKKKINMNWITKFIKPKIKSLFEKKSSKIEENLWTTCGCKNLIYKEDLEKTKKFVLSAVLIHKLTCKERFETFFDNKEFELIETPLPKEDPLNFQDKKKYTDRLKAARKLTGQDDAVLIAKGKVQNIDVVVGSQDFRFIGGSFGAASGEAFIAGAQHAIENKIPYIFFSCSGGQRMMESSIALMQMSRTALAVNELKKKNIPFMVILTDPTTGGVTASWAMLGDILIAEPKATIGFAGRRVIQDTVRETLPDEFQTAEYVFDHGQLI